MLERNIMERLFRQHYGKMIRLARILLTDDAEAEDMVQDVFARLMQTDIPPAEEKVEAYLMTAVHHACLNAIRHKTVWQQVRNLYPVGDETVMPSTDQMSERMDAIMSCVDELEEPHRSIFHLRFDEDLTIGEIARRLHLNVNTCYKYLRQSIEHIRQLVTSKTV